MRLGTLNASSGKEFFNTCSRTLFFWTCFPQISYLEEQSLSAHLSTINFLVMVQCWPLWVLSSICPLKQDKQMRALLNSCSLSSMVGNFVSTGQLVLFNFMVPLLKMWFVGWAWTPRNSPSLTHTSRYILHYTLLSINMTQPFPTGKSNKLINWLQPRYFSNTGIWHSVPLINSRSMKYQHANNVWTATSRTVRFLIRTTRRHFDRTSSF